jgi:hypothetical protein
VTFLSPWSALFAAAITLPLLLLLYFLKLRRQSLRIPSTLLWQKSFEDLQVNAPFQRLRWSALLALQLLVLILLLLALGDPVWQGGDAASKRVVVIIDRSASMNARVPTLPDAEAPSTRLDFAKQQARQVIERLGRSNGPEEIMLIAFGRNANVVNGFSSDRRSLMEALDSIEPSDEQGDLDAALQLASAFLGSRDEAELLSPPAVMLISDGNIAPSTQAEGYRLRAGRFTFVQVSPTSNEQDDANATSDNIGFVALGARRDIENPQDVSIFARLINTNPQPVETVITILIDSQPVAAIRKSIPGIDAGLPGESFITHQIEAPGDATIVLRHNRADDLTADDSAALVLPAPSRPRVLLVHPSDSPADSFLHDLLDAADLQQLQPISDDAYRVTQSSGSLAGQFDLVVFDRVNAEQLPGVPTLSVGAVPALLRAEPAPSDEGRHILSWDRQHALMRNVSLDTIVYSGFGNYVLPSSATALALGQQGPLIAAFRTRGVMHVAVGFEMVRSNWPLHISSAIFLQNVIDTLPGRASSRNDLTYQPGDSIPIRVLPDVNQLEIEGPEPFTVNASPGAMINLPALSHSGVYLIKGAAPPYQTLALSMLSDVESDIRPRSTVQVNAESATARREDGLASVPLWPWLVALAFALMTVEWLVYCRRARGS